MMAPTGMRPFGDVISLDAARAILDATGAPIDRTETISLSEANGRVVASDIVARSDVPPFSRAGMDGYAVRARDTEGASRGNPRALAKVATLYTGQVSPVPVRDGECIEISTGAPLPDGADAVVMVEETDTGADGLVRIFAEVRPQQNVGRQGADIQAGQVVVGAGDALNASRIGAVAATGTVRLNVYARPRVAILSTGNEVVEPGTELKPGQIYDINRFTLSAVVSDNGGIPIAFPPAPDSLDALVSLFDDLLACDIIVFSGGSSVGERDLVRDAITANGRLLFHGVAVKPGKPTGLGLVRGKPVFAMPGYPTSCLSNAHMLLVPMLRRISRLPLRINKTLTLPLAQRIASTSGRHQFYPVRIVNGTAVPAFKASGDITSMSRADGYIEIPANIDLVEAGASVDVTLF
ncbi:MAG: molybdenum cofactor biosynthesis protein [Acidobacteria bacterium]|nr:MAG: molybdenum cofactor biosynthesis protein [Acidobacteriota bacterium]